MGPVLDSGVLWLQQEKVEKFFDATRDAPPRDRALFAVIYGAALRVSEALALRVRDIDWKTGRVSVRAKKQKKSPPYSHQLDEDVVKALRAHVRAMEETRKKAAEKAAATAERKGKPKPAATWRLSPEDPLFPSRKSATMSRKTVAELFQTYAKKAGLRLERRQGVHSLRHSRAVHMLDGGRDVADVQDQLRHRSMASTLVYAKVSNRRRRLYEEALAESPRIARLDPKRRKRGAR